MTPHAEEVCCCGHPYAAHEPNARFACTAPGCACHRDAGDIERTARHEAGHAVAALHLGLEVYEVTVQPRVNDEGLVAIGQASVERSCGRRGIVVHLAGAAADKNLMYTDRRPWWSRSPHDEKCARALARHLYCLTKLAHLRRITLAVVEDLRRPIEALAAALLEREVLTGAEIKSTVAGLMPRPQGLREYEEQLARIAARSRGRRRAKPRRPEPWRRQQRHGCCVTMAVTP